MNTTTRIFAAALLSNFAVSLAAAGGFYAGGEMGVSTVPDLSGAAAQTMANSGYPTVTVSQNKGSGVAGIFGGQWVTDNFGWEAGLASLGYIRGRVAATNGTSTIFTSYRYSAGALSLAAMGGIDITADGKLFFKAGLFGAGVTYNGPTSTVSANSSGPMLSGGFSYRVMKHLSARVELANYIGVRFPNFEFFTPANNTTKSNITTLTVGAAYEF
jgi:hypothetical protein